MPGLLPNVDPEGLLEFSVVYTDRALNHMSRRFQGVMRDISAMLKEVYGAHATALVPGSGSFGMEAVARQFAGERDVLVLRNGFFSYRWSQILEQGRLTAPERITVLKARRTGDGPQAPWTPAPIAEVEAAIARAKPAVVFAPHVETASGIVLPDDYMQRVAAAVHAVGGIFVLDCVASGAQWVDMRKAGADVLITAPQKCWSSPPCGALVCFSERGLSALKDTTSSSFAADLKRWQGIMQTYENGGHAYHATMPTTSLVVLRDTMQETKARGFDAVCAQQIELGRKVRALLESRGLPSVAAEGYQAAGVVVSYTTDPDIQSGKAFAAAGLQTASGVPLMCDEPADFRTFRLGLFGLDKWANVDRAVSQLAAALDQMGVK
ncbi:MAG: aminotransferase class V-fold PLP-dependent enzyme [Burkholderiaceae bacterium]|jgi:aspartate aminotransferase-like enzyme|nr:aminotransferase class V-fold PLP-dependent enzyme [Burkholderiaceae bacterium]